MAMFVQHNITSMNATRNLGVTTSALAKSTEKLSSGYRINRAGDDAAGLAISEKMRGQIRGLDKASSNSQDGISLIQTAEGALTETHSILQRMRELSVQAASDTNTDDDREQIQNEINQLTSEVDRIATTTEFNTKKLLNGSVKGSVSVKSGSASVEGTFANGKVEASLTVGADLSLAGFTDVIRIEIKKDFTSDTKGFSDTATFTASSLFGYYTTAGYVSLDTEKGSIRVIAYSDSGMSVGYSADMDITKGYITISIDNINKLKAGDVITISTLNMIKSEAAATGKEAVRLQVGANAGQEVMLGINSMKAKDLDIVKTNGEALEVTEQSKASMAVSAFDMAIRKVSTERAKLGAVQNRLEHTIANLDTAQENLQSAESRIRDTDMADEMTGYSKNSILMQAGQSMLAQANQANQGVLSLLQ